MAKPRRDVVAPAPPGHRDRGVIVPGHGPSPAQLLLLGEAPGKDEVRATPPRPFVGRSGQEVTRYFNGDTLPYRSEVYATNVVKQQLHGKTVSKAELAHWRPVLDQEIAAVDPAVIVAFGATAARAILGSDVSMERMHGLAFWRSNRIVYVAYHPAATLHSPDLQSYFCADMEGLALGLANGFTTWEPDRVPERYGLLPLDVPIPTRFSMDTEGSARHPWGLTISWQPGVSYLAPADDTRRLDRVRQAVRRARRVTCQGLLYDLDVLAAMGISIPEPAFDDTQIMAYLLSLEPQGLKALAYRHLGAEQDEYLDVVAEADAESVTTYLIDLVNRHANAKVVAAATRVLLKIADPEDERRPRDIWKGSKFSKAVDAPPTPTLDAVRPRRKAIRYACRDADLTERLRSVLFEKIRQRGLEEVYRRDLDVLPIVNRMQHVGMRVDTPHFRQLLTTFQQDYLTVLERIETEVGREVNPNSGPQTAALLFDDLGLPGTRLVKSKVRYSTEDKYLEALRTAHPVVPLIIDGRELTKLKSAYAAAILSAAGEGDLIYPNLRITRVISGRVSAFDPNVLAIPKHSARGKLIRLGFLAGDGRLLLSHDLSQIELRVAAHDSQEPGMIETFRRGGDIHAALGHRIFGIKPADQDESKHRLPMKKVNFGIWMGISAKGISEQLAAAGQHWSEQQCQELITETFKVWPRIPEYQEEKIAQARRLGYVTDFCGRRRYLAGVRSDDKWIRLEAERQAHATPIQSGAQQVFKTWMAACWTDVLTPWRQHSGHYVEPWLQVHDDFIIECDIEAADELSQEILACIPQMLCVPTTAKRAEAERWGALEEKA